MTRREEIVSIITELLNKEAVMTLKEIGDEVGATIKSVCSWHNDVRMPVGNKGQKLRALLKKVRAQRIKDIRQVDDPVGGKLPTPDEMEMQYKQEQAKQQRIKKINDMDSPW